MIYKALSLVLKWEIFFQNRTGSEAAIAPGMPEMLHWWWPLTSRQLPSTGSLPPIIWDPRWYYPVYSQDLPPDIFQLCSKIGALPSRKMFRAFPTGSRYVLKGTVLCCVVQWQQCWTSWSFLAGCFKLNIHLTRYILGYLKKSLVA